MTAPHKQWSKEQWSIVRYNGRLIVRQGDAVVFDESESPLTESQWQFICERVNFCAGYSREAFELMSRALENDKDLSPLQELERINQSTCKRIEELTAEVNSLTQQAEANKEARDGEAYSDKLLCELWDKLGARGKIDEHESAVERIRDLIATEAELTEIRADLLKYGQHVYPCNGVYPTGATDCKCGWMARKESLSQPSPVEAHCECYTGELTPADHCPLHGFNPPPPTVEAQEKK